ncbi:MAG TPA: DUF2293 domain-containing protein [Magnetospirillum sp.]|nr:DUF2293 domain-containing protein [Magnetospirillum sp.]
MNARRGRIAEALGIIAPNVPAFDRAAILDHAEDSPGLRTASPQAAAWASLVAYVRHTYTDYDDLLADGTDVDAARFFVVDHINDVLAEWGCRKRVSDAPGEG